MSGMGGVTRWWWIRHAPVVGHHGRLYGNNDVSVDVSDRPRFEALGRILPQDAVWLASSLRRTHETAEAIQAAGHPVPGWDVEADLREQSFGDWQGRTWKEVEDALGEDAHKHWVAAAAFAPPGGESFVSVIGRVETVIAHRTARHAGTDIVAVAHGGTIRAALALALGLHPERALAFAIDNLSVTRIEHMEDPRQGEAWRVVSVNQPALP